MTNASSKNKIRVFKNDKHYQLIDLHGEIITDVSRFLLALETRGLSPRTVRAYAFDLLALYRWFASLKDKKWVKDLKQSDLLEFVRFQREMAAHPKTINRRLVVTELLYRFVTNENIGAAVNSSSPASYYRATIKDRSLGIQNVKTAGRRKLRVKVPKKLVEPLSIVQVKVLLGSFKRFRDIAIGYTMLLCGLRSREVLELKMRDICFDQNQIRVSGKGGVQRMLPLPAVLASCLQRYFQLEKPSHTHKEYVFVILQGSNRGHQMTTSGLRSLFRHRRRNDKIAIANPHRLRHTFGSDMARCGVQLPILQKLMGHADSNVTLQYINLSMADISKEFHRATMEIEKRYNENMGAS